MNKLLFFLLIGITLTLQAQLCEETIFESCEECYPIKIISVDFDFDGDEDLVLGSGYKGNFTWFEQLANGKYAPVQTLFSGMDGLSDFVIADFDKDGDYDIIYEANNPFIKVNRGVFHIENKETYFEAPTMLSDKFYNRLEVGNIDGDDDLDLIAISNSFYSNGYEIATFENLGNNAFGEKKVITTLPSSYHPAILADFNSDGLQDYLISHNDTIAVLFGELGNDFGRPVYLNPPVYSASGFFNIDYQPVDFDQDGDLDIVYQSGYFYWYENTGDGLFAEKKNITSVYFSSSLPWRFYDYDLDGLNDLVYVNYRMIAWSQNLGEMNFAPLDTLVQPPEMLNNGIRSQTAQGLATDGLYFYDWNNESLSQFALSELNQKIIGTVLPRKSPINIQAADFDGDGDEDFIALFAGTDDLIYFRNEGRGFFKETDLYDNIPVSPSRLILGDLDNDSDQDFLLLTGRLRILSFLNDGKGNFTQNHWFTKDYLNVFPNDIDLVDMDNDGVLELCIFHLGFMEFYKNNGDGTFDFHLRTPTTSGAYDRVQFKDINGDGLSEVLLLTSGIYQGNPPTEFIILYNQGNYVFDKVEAITNLHNSSKLMLLADLDDDGLEDFIYSHRNQLVWHPNWGNDSYGDSTYFTPAKGTISRLFAEDYDLDGDLDIIANSYGAGTIELYKNDGTGNYEEPEILIEGYHSYALQVADVNNDQYLDLLAGHYHHGKITLYKNRPIPLLSTINLEEMIVFPNPTNAQIYFDELIQGTFTIFDSQGRRLSQSNFNECGNIDLSHFPKGIYIIEVSTEEGSTTRKIVKQ